MVKDSDMSELVTVQHLANKVNPEIKFAIYKESLILKLFAG